jgi:hypothetical protein
MQLPHRPDPSDEFRGRVRSEMEMRTDPDRDDARSDSALDDARRFAIAEVHARLDEIGRLAASPERAALDDLTDLGVDPADR